MFNILVDPTTEKIYAIVPILDGMAPRDAARAVREEKAIQTGRVTISDDQYSYLVEVSSGDGNPTGALDDSFVPTQLDLEDTPTATSGSWDLRVGRGCEQSGNNDHSAYRNVPSSPTPKTVDYDDDTLGGKHGL
jgi:hypothetical protein